MNIYYIVALLIFNIDIRQLMEDPEGIRTLGKTEADMSQIFSISSLHESRRNFLKGLYKIKTLDAAHCDQNSHTHNNSFIQVHFHLVRTKIWLITLYPWIS